MGVELVGRAGEILKQMADPEALMLLSGGVELWIDGGPVLFHGCCVGVEHWIEWQRHARSGGPGPWNGHDPSSTAQIAGDTVTFEPSPDHEASDITAPLSEYVSMVDALEADLRAALYRARVWLAARVEEETATAVGDKLAGAMGL